MPTSSQLYDAANQLLDAASHLEDALRTLGATAQANDLLKLHTTVSLKMPIAPPIPEDDKTPFILLCSAVGLASQTIRKQFERG